MRWTLVNNINEMDYGLKEMNEMDCRRNKIKMKWDQ